MDLKKALLHIVCFFILFLNFCLVAQDKTKIDSDLKDINVLEDLNEGAQATPQNVPQSLPRIDVPSDSDQKKAIENIRNTYAEKYKSTDVRTRCDLANELLNEAKEKGNPGPVRYAFFIESVQVSASVGDAASVMRSLKYMEDVFKINRIELAEKELVESEKFARIPAELAAFAEAYLECYRNLFENELFDDALKNLNLASAAAKKANNDDLIGEIRECNKEIQAVRKEYSLVAGGFDKLKGTSKNSHLARCERFLKAQEKFLKEAYPKRYAD